jgi:ubiquitin-protein ligase
MDDELISRNNEIFAQFKTIALRRRLKKEVDKMYADYDKIDVELTDKGDARVNIYKIEENNQLHMYGFVLTRDYPFRAPVIFFQNRPYIDFLRTRYMPNTDTNVFKRITGLNCFCCFSVNCSDNWSPSITLEKIISEIHLIKKKKRDIINKIIADKIKARYLVDDIDLDSWLF